MSYQVKIFRGTCAEVQLQMHQWFAARSITVQQMTQTEQGMNVLTVTVLYVEAGEASNQTQG